MFNRTAAFRDAGQRRKSPPFRFLSTKTNEYARLLSSDWAYECVPLQFWLAMTPCDFSYSVCPGSADFQIGEVRQASQLGYRRYSQFGTFRPGLAAIVSRVKLESQHVWLS